MKRNPEEVIERLRSYTDSQYYDKDMTELLREAADTIEILNRIRMEEARGEEKVTGPRRKELIIAAADWKVKQHQLICNQLNAVYAAKNHDYGDSFARIRQRYPQAIMIRLWDKLLRLETLMFGERAKVDESIEDTLKDLANYAIMELVERGVNEDDEQ